MLKKLPSLDRLVRQLQQLPYLASKNIYKVALHFLHMPEHNVEAFCDALREAKRNVTHCTTCFNWSEGSALCSICTNTKRNKDVVCVVETWYDLMALERASGYDGLYHVLGGALSPLEGIGVDQLRIKELLARVWDSDVRELIFATNPTPEGEATANFIFSKLKESRITLSRLASGVPIGSSLEYMDRVTIHKALLGRRPF